MTATLTNPFTAARVTEAALKRAQARNIWVGYSGESVTGAEAAAALAAIRAVIDKRGLKTAATKDPDITLPDVDDSMKLKDIVLAMWREIRASVWDDHHGPISLHCALYEVKDADARNAANKVLDALVLGYTGADFALATSWAERPARTWDEVRDLLDAGVDFARTHGPA
jgi:hypothetical protein